MDEIENRKDRDGEYNIVKKGDDSGRGNPSLKFRDFLMRKGDISEREKGENHRDSSLW